MHQASDHGLRAGLKQRDGHDPIVETVLWPRPVPWSVGCTLSRFFGFQWEAITPSLKASISSCSLTLPSLFCQAATMSPKATVQDRRLDGEEDGVLEEQDTLSMVLPSPIRG